MVDIALPVYLRRGHRILAILWLLSLVRSLATPAASEELPGPSLPALFFITTIITGSYLLVRPWIRGTSTVSERVNRLKR